MEDYPYVHTYELHNTNAANYIVPYLIKWFNPLSVIDVGCGLGTWLKVFKSKGVVDVLGIEGSHINKKMMVIHENEILLKDLEQPVSLNRRYDIALCIEVVEHLSKDAADIIISTLVNLSDIIVFSAAIPGQGGQNHLNEQWIDYWIEKFKKHDFIVYDPLRKYIWENTMIEWWYSQNIVIAIKSGVRSPFKHSKVLKIVHPELFKKRYNERTEFMHENYQLKKKLIKAEEANIQLINKINLLVQANKNGK